MNRRQEKIVVHTIFAIALPICLVRNKITDIKETLKK